MKKVESTKVYPLNLNRFPANLVWLTYHSIVQYDLAFLRIWINNNPDPIESRSSSIQIQIPLLTDACICQHNGLQFSTSFKSSSCAKQLTNEVQ